MTVSNRVMFYLSYLALTQG